jgi:hypothetical protein
LEGLYSMCALEGKAAKLPGPCKPRLVSVVPAW